MSKGFVLASAQWRMWLDPSRALGWLALETLIDGNWLSVVPDCRAAALTGNAPTRAGQNERAPLTTACFHMLPYSNRVRDGQFRYRGVHYQLDHAERHAIHGAFVDRPFRVIEQTPHSLTGEYDSRRDGTLNWPWPLAATISYKLSDTSLRGTLALTNCGATSMPAGLGWHAYFIRTIGGSGPTLTLPVREVYPDAAGDGLPDGAPVALPEALNFRTARALDQAQRIDNCFAGLHGPCLLTWPAANLTLSLHTDRCRHLVLYNPDMPHFAVEPVSNANNGFNLAAAGVDAGVVDIQPGDTLTATLTLERLG